MDTIRIIHNLPRSGGTIISKSISAQKNISLLSEIHPIGPNVREKMKAQPVWGDPLYQFQSWYKLFNDKEYDEIKESNLDFLSKIKMINQRVKNKKKTLVIRDWSFVDFFGKPFVDPINEISILKELSNDFEIKNIFIIRDPIEMFISCNNGLNFFRNNYSFDTFLDAYESYFENIKQDNYIKFENFIDNPIQNLKKISQLLDFKYDENYYKNLANIKITGDVNAIQATNITFKEKKSNLLNDDQKKIINQNAKYLKIKQKLNSLI